MRHIVEKNWVTGGLKEIDFYDLLNLSREHIHKGAKLFIGSDSFIAQGKICFASALCLHGSNKGGRYFFFKDFVPKHKFMNLVSRITEETRRSVEIATLLMNEYNFDPSTIELHLDVSPFGTNNGTSRYSDMLKGYVQGFGIDYRLKPDAWASQTIADRHSK
mgnify:CR=1 FL=1|tara:strand:- start:500 stop:985 length:486 start_codon:yes stop_codon:yes gene_type:complete